MTAPGGAWEDARAATRSLARDRRYTVAALATLTLGLGAAGGLLGMVDSVLLRPLPYPDADRIHGVWFVSPTLPGALDRLRHSEGTYLHWRDRSDAYESFALAERYTVTLDDGAVVTRLPAARVTSDVHAVLGREAAVGRSLAMADMAPGAEPVVVLADATWSERFGRSPNALGTLLTIDGVSRRIVGVLPADVRFPAEDVRLWVPMTIDEAEPAALSFLHTAYGRLAPGRELAAAEADFVALTNRLPDVMPSAFPRPLLERAEFSPRIEALPDVVLGESSNVFRLLAAAVLVLLALVATSFTGLAVARTDRRMRDFAVRIATGASGGRVRRMIVLEALLPALAGAALGLALAFPVVAAFVAGAGDLLPRTIGVGVTLPAVAVTLLAAVGVGALAGAVSLGRLRTAGIAERLRSGAGAVGGGRSSARLRNGLVAAQVALAVVLVFDAGLLVRSFQRLANVPLGLHEEGVLGAAISLDGSAYADFEEGSAFLRAFVDEVAVLPGVEAAALSNHAPLREGRIFYPFVAEDVPETLELPHPQLTRVVTEGYFAATGIDVVAGRPLDRDDVLLDRPVVVVSRALADAWWPGSAALGRRLSYGFDQEAGEPSWLEVVGVADDVRDRTITGAAPGMVYAPFQSRHLGGDRWRELYVTVRSSAAGGLAAPLRSLLAERDRSVPLYDVRTIDRVLADVTRRDRTVTLLLAAAGALALLLATVGLYGSLAFAVGQRRREIGLRLALGAEPNGVRGLVIRQSGALVGAGLVVGAALVYATRNVVAGALFETNPDDPGAIAMALALLAAVGFAATWGPAHQASSVPPTITLKEN